MVEAANQAALDAEITKARAQLKNLNLELNNALSAFDVATGQQVRQQWQTYANMARLAQNDPLFQDAAEALAWLDDEDSRQEEENEFGGLVYSLEQAIERNASPQEVEKLVYSIRAMEREVPEILLLRASEYQRGRETSKQRKFVLGLVVAMMILVGIGVAVIFFITYALNQQTLDQAVADLKQFQSAQDYSAANGFIENLPESVSNDPRVAAEITKIQEVIRQKEQRVESLAKELGTGDSQALSIKHQMALEQISLLRREHARVRFELMRAQINEQSVGVSGVDTTSPVLLGSAAGSGENSTAAPSQAAVTANRISQLKSLITRYESQVVDQNHPTLKKYRDELKQLLASAGEVDATTGAAAPGSRLDILKRQEKLLAEELEKYSDLVKNIGSSSFELELMKSEIAQISKVSDQVGSEMEAHRIELKSPTRITLMQEAEVPQLLDLGKKKKLTGAAGFGALGFVFLAVSLVEFHSRRITDPQDISQTLGLDLLGSLPAMPKPLIKFWEQPKESRMALWNNALIEAVDSTRSILLHDPDVEQRRVLMVASAAAQEGKTTFACQLAGSLARAGRKTVLVDFDLRRPRAHELLNVPLELGLSELLSEKLDVQTVLHSTAEPSLSVIPAGRVNEAALQSIARDGADWLFKELKKEFEFVIVDSSPILYVADGASVGRNVDGAIMVVRSHASRLPAVAVACERVEMLGIDLVGGVMVGVQSNLNGYGYSYDYHYGSTSS